MLNEKSHYQKVTVNKQQAEEKMNLDQPNADFSVFGIC